MTQSTPLLSRVSFGALLAYSPRGKSDTSFKSQITMRHIKNAHPPIIARAMEVLEKTVAGGVLAEFFGSDIALVPAPRSAPLVKGGLWPGKIISNAIVSAGLAGEVLPLLQRTHRVEKSALAKSGKRPSVNEHLGSIAVDIPPLIRPEKITIVDDVITMGSTLLACASLIKNALPDTEVRVFGLLRTRGFVDEIEEIIDPCDGNITWDGNKVRREP